MPRIPLVYTDELPYHVVARSNNKDAFYLPIDDMWNLFARNLNRLSKDFRIRVHAFVLMNNHYHLIVNASDRLYLGDMMQQLQKSVSRSVNFKANRINHVFGGPYKGSLIDSGLYYAHVLKYVYRNPVKAGICEGVQDYPYSTLNSSDNWPITTVAPDSGIDSYLPNDLTSMLSWMNVAPSSEMEKIISNGLKRTTFKIAKKNLNKFEL